MTDLGPLYRVDFEVEEPTKSHVVDGLSHVYLDMQPAVRGFDQTRQYSYSDLLNAWRWHAGLMARVGVSLLYHVEEARKAHGCEARYRHEQGGQCLELHTDDGWLLTPHMLVNPRHDSRPEPWQEYPYLSVVVPGEKKRLALWCKVVQKAVNQAVASDLEPSPLAHEHAGVVLTDPAAAAEEEPTR